MATAAQELETVRIANPEHPGESRVINARDFQPSVHTLFQEPCAPAGVAEPDPAPVTLHLLKPAEALAYLERLHEEQVAMQTRYVARLKEFLDAEQQHQKPGGRKAVADAITSRLAAMTSKGPNDA